MSEPKKFGMRIVQILDKTTVVIAGDGIERVSSGDTLLIVAVGNYVPEIKAPLVVKKAELEADSVNAYYIIARTPQYETTIPDNIVFTLSTTRKTLKRDALRVDESVLVGNPAVGPVRLDDPVVRESELSDFVEMQANKYK